MLRKVSFCIAALLVASPALAQSVVISESAPQTQPLSPSLGGTESLAIVTPAMAEALTEVPMVTMPPASGEVMPSLGTTESLALITPSQAETFSESSSIGIENEPSIIDTLPRITPAMAATLVADDIANAQDAAPLEEDVSIYVVEEGEVLPASAWGTAASEACKASGGVELTLPAGRIGCFKL